MTDFEKRVRDILGSAIHGDNVYDQNWDNPDPPEVKYMPLDEALAAIMQEVRGLVPEAKCTLGYDANGCEVEGDSEWIDGFHACRQQILKKLEGENGSE